MCRNGGDVILVAARSDVFSAMFEHEMEERKHVSITFLHRKYKRYIFTVFTYIRLICIHQL